MLSIIIVNYKSVDLCIQCIDSIEEHNKKVTIEYIVVDNDSKDDSERRLKARYPKLRYVQMGYNAGFGRANNAGMNIATGDCFLLLNSDTISKSNAIELCYERLLQSSHAAAGIKLNFYDGSPQHSGFYFSPYAINFLLNIPYMGRLFSKVASLLKMKKPFDRATNTVSQVDWINGAFLMVKKEVYAKTKGFDEDFFLFSEETEWCFRIGKHGTLILYNDLSIIHLQGETIGAATQHKDKGYTDVSGKRGLQILVSGLLRIRKQYGTSLLCIHVLAFLLCTPILFIISVIRLPLHFSKLELRKDLSALSNIFRMCNYVIPIMTNAPKLYKTI